MAVVLSSSLNRRAAFACSILPFFFGGASAQEMTAGVILEKMEPKEQVSYMAGIIEGLAYARYEKDGKKTEGMGCIYQWFHNNDKTLGKIDAAFRRFKDYPPGAVIAAMVKKECGE